MLRKCVVVLSVAALSVVAFTSWRIDSTAQPRPAPASTGDPHPAVPNAPALKPANLLPISSVVLFNSGVGYFQRSGRVEGDARIDLQFPAGNINDLIKSLVVDDERGKVLPLSYDSQEPVEKSLRSFAIDLSTNPSFGQILNQARGEKVEVSLNTNATGQPASLTGTIIGMEAQQRPGTGPGQPGGEIELLNLMCAEGLRSVSLKDVQRLRFLNTAIEQELRRALDVVAIGHDSQKKAVRLAFKGEGKRQVKVGYVVENPIWKTSYRVVLNGKDKPRLFGWANVENTSDEDWNDVKLTLVASRPISFQMDLYPPLYIPRPTVEPEVFASLRPPAYQGPLMVSNTPMQAGMQGGVGVTTITATEPSPLAVPGVSPFGTPVFGQQQGIAGQMQGFQGAGGSLQGFGGFQAGGYQAVGGGQPNGFSGFMNIRGAGIGDNRYHSPGDAAAGQTTGKLKFEELQKRRGQTPPQENQKAREDAKRVGSTIANVDPRLVDAALATQDLGNSARYAIEERVNLPRQQSAMLPILDQVIEAKRVSIYNESVQAKHPLLGLKIRNTSEQSLMQGPMTIYDGEQYLGDARVFDLQPAEERFISYAIDTAVEVKSSEKQAPSPDMTISLQGDRLHVQYNQRQTRTYLIRNRSGDDRVVVIEQPVREGWKLVIPEQAAERTRDLYRFAVNVRAGATVSYDVAQEEPRNDPFSLTKRSGWNWFATSLGLDVWTEINRLPEDRFVVQVVPARDGPGLLRVTHKDRRLLTYFLRNDTDDERLVWLEHVVPPGRKLIGEFEPVADDARRYRFKLALPAGQTTQFTVTEEFEEPQPEDFALKLVEGTPVPRPGKDDLPQMRYVTELGFEVWTERKKHADALTSVCFVKGSVQSVTTESESTTYHLRNRSDRQRTFLLEHVVRQDWAFVGNAKPISGADQRYQFELKGAKDQVLHQEVSEEHPISRTESLTALTDQRIREMLDSKLVRAPVKDALRKGWSMQTALIETRAALEKLRSQLKEITEEQARLRLNLEKLPNTSALYKRYLDKLDQQESALEKVQEQIAQRVESEAKHKNELERFLDNLNVE